MAASSSLATVSLTSRHCFTPNSKISYPTTQSFFKSHILNSFPSLRYLRKLLKPVKAIQFLSRPTSEPSLLPFLSPPQKEISAFWAEKIVTVLLGSLLFVGCLASKPVLAQPVQEGESSEKKGDAQFGRSGDEEDEVMCEKLLEENPRNVGALKMVVNVKMKRGNTSESVEYVERLIELQPNEMEWRLLQALCYEMMGNLSKAKTLFKNILEQKPLLLRALHGLAMVMHKNHEGPAVFEMLERALEEARQEKRVNEERNIRILLAKMRIIKGDLEEALEKLQALIDENPRDFRPYLCQGIPYSLLDKRKEAEGSFDVYRNLVPDEFPQRGFLDDVVLAAKSGSKQKLEEELQS